MNIFDNQPNITKADRDRLLPHLEGGWNKLNEILVLDSFCTEDYKKLVLLELEGNKRTWIIGRLLSKGLSKERKEVKERIRVCLRKS